MVHRNSICSRFAREIMFTSESGDRVDAPDIAVALTDGASNVNPENTPTFANHAHMDVSN